jgi:hypothetical protein
MPRDDEIDDQVRSDWEFTRRAQQLMSKLRTQGTTGAVVQETPSAGEDDTPPKK